MPPAITMFPLPLHLVCLTAEHDQFLLCFGLQITVSLNLRRRGLQRAPSISQPVCPRVISADSRVFPFTASTEGMCLAFRGQGFSFPSTQQLNTQRIPILQECLPYATCSARRKRTLEETTAEAETGAPVESTGSD